MPLAFVAAPILLAAVLIIAAASKWKNRDSLISSLRLLRMPTWLHAPSKILPEVEVGLAVLLLVVPWWQGYTAVAVVVLGLMLVYLGIIIRGLTMTPRPSCGCFGQVGSPITTETLARNIVLSVLGIIAVVWGLAGNSVPATAVAGGLALWAWLLMLAATAAITRWIVAERRPALGSGLPPGMVPAADAGLTFESNDSTHTDEVDDEDYVREPIPVMMLMDGDKPITMASLARERACLLIWVTCGCGRSHDAVTKAEEWREAMPMIDVRVVSTLPLDQTQRTFPGERDWLIDVHGQALHALSIRTDPAAILLGADGLLAGGPVAGLADVTEFGEQIREQLAETERETTADDVEESHPQG